jgi:hypothetical protein
VPGPACLLAFVAWQAGEGALARVALDRAIGEHSGHHLVELLDRLLVAGIGPHAVAAFLPPEPGGRGAGGRGARVRAAAGGPGAAGTGDGRRARRGTRRRSR